jgi:SecD/SecF fusion protein
LEPGEIKATQEALEKEYGIKQDAFNSTSVGPTFGTTIANSARNALIFSLIVICAYIAFRFDPKFAVPVLIALFHDILITAGVYSLTGREVTSGTVAAFLTILGYSMYDTIIVFDRIRENMPRMPRAAFSQIVNRSMSEVLTRSLATSFSTLLAVTSLLVFGGVTLQDFAFAMLVGIASGTYSSIFIASPVLTAWKEREPGFARRRERIAALDGSVPAFADDVELARLADDSEAEGGVEEGEAAAPEREAPRPAGAVATAEPDGDGAGPSSNGETAAAEQASAERRQRNAERRERRQQRRRKHGRNR